MKTCKNCNLSYVDDKIFCKKCGNPLTSEYQIEPKEVAKRTVFEDRLKADPLNIELLHEYAQFLFNNLIFRETITVSLKILAINEMDGVANELLFKSYLKLNMLKEASEFGKQILSGKPTDIFLLQELAEITGKLGNANKEAEYYDQILRLNPTNLAALLNKAHNFLEENQLEKAIEIFSNLNNDGQNDRITTIYSGINKALKADHKASIKLLSSVLNENENLNQNDINTDRGILYLTYSLCQNSSSLPEIKKWAKKINYDNLILNYHPLDEKTAFLIAEIIINRSLNEILIPNMAESQIRETTNSFLPESSYSKNSNSKIAEIWHAIGIKQGEMNLLKDAVKSFQKASVLMPSEIKHKEKYTDYIKLFENETRKRKRKTNFIIASSIICLIIIVFSILAYMSFEEKSAFKSAKLENSSSSYQAYMDKYPKGKYYSEAQQLKEEASWTNAKTLNTVEIYDSFISQYGNSKHFQEAISLKEEALWVFSKKTKNYSNYLRQYPSGKYIKDIRYDIPDIERIKSDLIGQRILGWSFDALSEIKQSNISNTTNNPTRIEFEIDLSLIGLTSPQTDIHEAKILVTYLLNDNGWYFNDVKEIFITYTYTAPLNDWLSISPIKNSTYTIIHKGQRFWVKDGSYGRKYKGGVDGESYHLSSYQIYISSRESYPVEIIIKYSPSN
jgi:hypothetical protein